MRPASISRREWRWVFLYAVFIAVLTTLPYVLAWEKQGADWSFGGSLFGADDGYSYLGKMRLGARGLWDFHLFYTSEPSEPEPLVFLPYILPGHVVSLFIHDDGPALETALAVTFHVLRVIFDLLLIAVLYRFIADFLRSPRVRFLALVLATLGGGFGWLLSLAGHGSFLGSLPPEFYIPEGFGFLVLFGLPHLALARAAILGGLLFLFEENSNLKEREGRKGDSFSRNPLRSLRSLRFKNLFFAALCWNIAGLAVPFYLVVIYAALGAWGLAVWIRQRVFPWRLAVRCIIAAGLTLPMFIYFTLIFSQNPAFAQWSAQNLLPSPHPIQYALAYALVVIPGLIGARRAWHRARTDIRYALLIGWPLLVIVLVYLPVNVQRRTAEAIIVPLAILAATGVQLWARQGRGLRGRKRRWTWGAIGLAFAASLSSLFLLFGGVIAALNPGRPLFRPTEELAAMSWLNHLAAADDVALSSKSTSNVIPAYTHLRTYIGHGPETLNANDKEPQVAAFFSDQMTSDQRQAFLTGGHIAFIFYGPVERELSAAGDTTRRWTTGLSLVYDRDGYQIYRVPSAES
jgi:hypothetical protein